jgi:hypothetical protein
MFGENQNIFKMYFFHCDKNGARFVLRFGQKLSDVILCGHSLQKWSQTSGRHFFCSLLVNFLYALNHSDHL